MKNTAPARFAGLALFCCGAWAQGVQNMDFSFLFGAPAFSASIPSYPAVKLNEGRGYAQVSGFGYQVARFSAATLFAEFAPLFVIRGTGSANVPGSVHTSFIALTVRARLMLPVQSRLSAYVALGGGAGFFRHLSVVPDDTLRVQSDPTTHGVFDLAPGVDIRLTRRLSLRVEARDIVSGRGLSGAPGRHHLVPLAGVASHF